MELEKTNQIDEAICLYEENVTDWFRGNHPYDRLRVIYSERKQYNDVIRVCESFVKAANEFITLGSPRSDLSLKRDKFKDWANKFRDKL
jgi:hypothetical protein